VLGFVFTLSHALIAARKANTSGSNLRATISLSKRHALIAAVSCLRKAEARFHKCSSPHALIAAPQVITLNSSLRCTISKEKS